MSDSDDLIRQKKEEGKKKRLANLRPIKKGEIRNPTGRPSKDRCLTSIIKAMLPEKCGLLDKNGIVIQKTWREILAEATMRLAVKGNSTALKEVWDRIDGKQAQTIDLNATVRRIEDDIADIEREEEERKRIAESAKAVH